MYVKLDGKTIRQSEVSISPDNRSFRYGDGCFETLKVINGRISLKDYHLQRLLSSVALLRFNVPSYFNGDYIAKHILELAAKNNHASLGRIRLTIFRGDGGLYDAADHFPHHLIQSWSLNKTSNNFNENGLVTDIYQDSKKAADTFSRVKSNNFLGYAMAALWAKQHRLNDCLLLNPFNFVTDSTIANVFIVKDGLIKTPPLSDGPIDGVMRKHLIAKCSTEQIPLVETSLRVEDLEQADEMFFTNAIHGIKWVKEFAKSNYTNETSALLYKKFITPLFAA